ncbi:MAG: SlyX family protein [Planctomycetia bacterium]|nr:SlyX family protein [Planctomycetia bacterium]
MGESESKAFDRLNQRVVELEALFMHLQRTVNELDQVVLAQQKRLEVIERKVAALGADLSSVASSITEERKPEDEKPPHY